MRGALATQNLGFERERHGYKTQMEVIQTQLNEMGNLLCVVAGSKRIKKAHNLSNGSISTSSWAVEDTSHITSSKSPPVDYFSSPSSGFSFDPLSLNFQFLEGFELNDYSSFAFDPPAFTAPPSPKFPIQYPPSIPVEPVNHMRVLQATCIAPCSPEEHQQYYFQCYGTARFQKHSPEWLNGDWAPPLQVRERRCNLGLLGGVERRGQWIPRGGGVDNDLGCQMAVQQLGPQV
ncbi:hypothetical protein DFH08DRAFT_805968 [Mycena albidolilacea]|uniref:Uncharacterized protein n=1 Tax=Mycena albidolilacea TaxID=1033008 RepID=A0AAD7A7G6_9AGAR|nr:hypothetical protein DFH08DRAFT_805968 [Mycena albidolilacea]